METLETKCNALCTTHSFPAIFVIISLFLSLLEKRNERLKNDLPAIFEFASGINVTSKVIMNNEHHILEFFFDFKKNDHQWGYLNRNRTSYKRLDCN
jgi:hypothetical protein